MPRSAARGRASSSTSRTAASTSIAAAPRTLAWVASSSPSRATGAGSGIVSTSTSPGCVAGHHGVHHQIVVLAAADGARRAGRAASGHDLDQRQRRRGLRGRTPRARSPYAASSARRASVTSRSQLGHHLREDALERLGEPHVRLARGRGARGCRAAPRAGRSRSADSSAPSSPAIAARFCSITDVMSTNVVGVKLQSSGWCGSKRSSSGGVIVANALATPAPAARAARALDGDEGGRVVRVERVAVGVRDDHVGRELADRVDERRQRRRRRPRAGSRRSRGSGSSRRARPRRAPPPRAGPA